MKIVLINPPIVPPKKIRNIEPVINNLFFNSPPLGLCYLAAVLERQNIPVKIIDAAVENLSIPQIIQRLKEFDITMVGLTSTTFGFGGAVKLAREIKEKNPHIPIILGGPHVSANPEHALSFDDFDIGVLGEGEMTFPEIIKFLENKWDLQKVDGIVFRRDSQLIYTKPRKFIEDLDGLPFPARHLLPLELYRPQPNDEYRLPKLSMISSRGCPYRCIFCDKNVFGHTHRSFSADYIVSEMEYLVKDFGAKDIAFVDSLFTVNLKRVESICELICRRKLKVSWTCTVRANQITKGLLKKMKETGCWRVRIGIESGEGEILKFIKKDITIEQVKNAVNWTYEVGLQPKGFFMIGHLIDTKETIDSSIKLAKALPLKDITVQINTPLPSTPQYSILKEYGTLIDDDFSDFSFWQPVFVPYGLSKNELLRLHRKFYRSFYLRPKVIWRHLSGIRTLNDFKRYLKVIKLLLSLSF